MLSQWIADLQSADLNVRHLAEQELQKLGPADREAVPVLIAALQQAQREPGQWPLLYGVVRALEAIGPDARAAVPLLVSLVDANGASGWQGAAPAFAILRIGGEPFEERLAVRSVLGVRFPGSRTPDMDEDEVRAALTSQNPVERIGPSLAELLTEVPWRILAAERLAAYGSEAKPFAPALVAALSDPSWWVRINVARALVAVAPECQSEASAALFPFLLNLEATPCVCYALRQIGADGVALLRQELRGSSAAGRAGAARALGLLASPASSPWGTLPVLLDDGAAGAAVEDLVAVLDDGAAEVRYAAAQALVRIDASRATPAIPHLVAGLESTDAKIRSEAANMLARLAQAGRPAEVALPALSKLLTDREVCLEAALALAAIHPRQAVAAVPVLVEALERAKPLDFPSYDESGPAAVVAILVAVGRIGPPASVAVPLLRQAVQSPARNVRFNAAVSLVRVAPELTTDAVNTLLQLVVDSSGWEENTFWEPVGALAEIGPAARKAVPQLEERLFDEAKRDWWWDVADRDPAPTLFSALVKIDPTASARVLAHIEADLQAPVRFVQAVRLLLGLAREVPASAPLLARLLEDNRAEGQWDSILSILGGFGPNAKDIASLLQEHLKSATPERASRINDVLARIGRAC